MVKDGSAHPGPRPIQRPAHSRENTRIRGEDTDAEGGHARMARASTLDTRVQILARTHMRCTPRIFPALTATGLRANGIARPGPPAAAAAAELYSSGYTAHPMLYSSSRSGRGCRSAAVCGTLRVFVADSPLLATLSDPRLQICCYLRYSRTHDQEMFVNILLDDDGNGIASCRAASRNAASCVVPGSALHVVEANAQENQRSNSTRQKFINIHQ